MRVLCRKCLVKQEPESITCDREGCVLKSIAASATAGGVAAACIAAKVASPVITPSAEHRAFAERFKAEATAIMSPTSQGIAHAHTARTTTASNTLPMPLSAGGQPGTAVDVPVMPSE